MSRSGVRFSSRALDFGVPAEVAANEVRTEATGGGGRRGDTLGSGVDEDGSRLASAERVHGTDLDPVAPGRQVP